MRYNEITGKVPSNFLKGRTTMSFGKTIKTLRRNADMTQEQLAEALSISPQAVSRWETDATMPDISLLPAICHLFDVSADTLLAISNDKKKERIAEIAENASSFYRRGYHDEAREILEAGLREFPNAYRLMEDLMYVSSYQSEEGKYTREERKAFQNQAIEIGEKILASCTEDSIRHSAVQILCFEYKDLGELEKAKELAMTMPCMAVSEELLMSRVTAGDEQYRAKQIKVYYLLQFLERSLGAPMNTKLNSGKWAYTEDEIAKMRDKRVALLELMFENGDFGFYHTHLCDCHSAQAEYYAKKGNAEETIRHLDKAAEHAIKFVTEFDEEATHTSLVFRGYEYGIFSTGNTSNDALELLEKMERPCYDFVRETEAFCGIQESLKIHAQKWQVKE